MYYPCSENKGADQLRGYREADLRLCFHLCKLLVFSRGEKVLKFSFGKPEVVLFDLLKILEAVFIFVLILHM